MGMICIKGEYSDDFALKCLEILIKNEYSVVATRTIDQNNHLVSIDDVWVDRWKITARKPKGE